MYAEVPVTASFMLLCSRPAERVELGRIRSSNLPPALRLRTHRRVLLARSAHPGSATLVPSITPATSHLDARERQGSVGRVAWDCTASLAEWLPCS